MKILTSILFALFSLAEIRARIIKVTNKCGYAIWVNPLTNGQGSPLPDGIQRLSHGASHSYSIPASGWGGRFWPKTGCDYNGQNCAVGQSISPCGPTGCAPPADTKVEFFFPPLGNRQNVWYDISLVDGYSLPVEITPSVQRGSCVTTRCAVSLNKCPTHEANVGDLRVITNGKTVQCLSPCKKWNYPHPFGLGQSERMEPGVRLCCPTPPISPNKCRSGIVVDTQYVSLIHRDCPTAYSYAYDDEAGLHNCPNKADFRVTFCP